ncbi:response regulator transcription factor [Actinomadura meridiana]|uniref:Response regulator transcription factor n=1 Tax=Actinomadura meridiana TaxID=559626 RepID=A0ABP8C4T1_9ACTN
MSLVRLMVADDEPMVLAGLRTTLCRRSSIAVVAEASNGAQALALCRSVRPDVVLMDTSMPVMDGFQATEAICGPGGVPGVRIVMYGQSDSDEHLFRALRSGVLGFARKNASPDELINCIHRVHRGEAGLSPGAVTRLVSEFSRTCASAATSNGCLDVLSPRERDVLELLLRGLRYDEIAARLTLSKSTAKSHLRNICHKLDVRDRTELVIYAHEHGLPLHSRCS